MKTNQQVMDDFLATRRYDKTPGDWRAMPDTDPDELEKVGVVAMLKAISVDWHPHEHVRVQRLAEARRHHVAGKP
jgi:hypothetical protein